MNTVERLQSYYDFDDTVLQGVARAAKDQNLYNFAELADHYGVANGTQRVVVPETGKAIELLKIVPDADYDEHDARVYHQAYGAGIDKNAAMHAIRLFGAEPSRQLVVFGSASAAGTDSGRLPTRMSLDMYRNRTFDPLVRPSVQHLARLGITHATHLGYSAGADKAVVATKLSSEYDQVVGRGVAIEPVSIQARRLHVLAREFAGTRGQQRRYITQTGSAPYQEVWDADSFKQMALFSAGLLRATNVATAAVLARGGFANRLSDALQAQPAVTITVGWGTKSELVQDQAAIDAVLDAQAAFAVCRVSALRLRGMHHAGVDDIDLHAAMMLQGERG